MWSSGHAAQRHDRPGSEGEARQGACLVERLQTEFLRSAHPDGELAQSAKEERSRERLYRHFSDREAAVAGVLQRELRRFVDGLAISASDKTSVTEASIDAFIYSVECLRDQKMLLGIIDHDIRLASGELRNHAGAMIALVRRVLPDLDIGRRVETNAGDVLATRELDRELTNKVPGQVPVEQQPHAGVASRRSRTAANSIAARTCPAVNSGKSATISSTVMPDAR